MSDVVQNYNTISRIFHWSIALLILGLLGVGFFMEAMERSPLKFEIYGVHKALGMVVIGALAHNYCAFPMRVLPSLFYQISDREKPLEK